jgi:hypothetical protein
MEGDSYRRTEVITGKRRRRQWTAEEKARIVAESFEEGANISEVGRRHGVVRGLLTVWADVLAARREGPADHHIDDHRGDHLWANAILRAALRSVTDRGGNQRWPHALCSSDIHGLDRRRDITDLGLPDRTGSH